MSTGASLGAYTALGYVFSNELEHVATYSTKIGEMAVLARRLHSWGFLIVRKLVRLYRFFCEFRASANHTQSP
jgi:hypothetical protein